MHDCAQCAGTVYNYIYRVILPHSVDGRELLLLLHNVQDAEQDEGTVYILYITILACAVLYM